ncbi:MAG: T9SS type A sorting domain-containing protein [Opitutaceae bacterium]|nr:T9SS type A sorting domain-containing protein [Cytophagales bacterium]
MRNQTNFTSCTIRVNLWRWGKSGDIHHCSFIELHHHLFRRNPEAILIDVFPNPAKDLIHISGLKVDVLSKMVLKDMKGVVVLDKSENLSKDLDISKIENGAYLVEISSAKSTKRIKLIIQK